ncbi:ADP-ribosylation factor-like protein 15 isoform X1 [Pteropus medius]|uniref:ADP-ribosylation factor-like protein 15 isoform X1 n=1 Tax=Pteropus vampyrus TaxID=132908 RepID=UPI00196AB1DD|nr:ADP-ribosylation factor-like protein 15 isoform X1 [Pteropus giganteus]
MTDLRITEAFLYMDYLLLEAGRESFVCVLSIVLWTGCHHLTFFIWRRVERKRNENKRMSECIQISFAVCRIGIYTCFRALCCKGPPPARPEYDLVCIGLTGSGKTSLLSKLCSESPDNVVSTTGFSIKAVPFQNAILNVKELGGADNIRKYWSRYYQGSQGVIFVLDSASSEDDLETARNELHSALQHPQLCTLPFLILANHQDKPAARSVQEVKKYFELEPLARGKRWILQPCSLDDMDALKDSFSQLINLLEEKDHEAVRM